ncbi:MAG: magnesium/cobalt transporter CorA [Proteobacteria bacterium]|nr:magnesium/cobalt transporter CorA [Pseudomonadota bacterium]
MARFLKNRDANKGLSPGSLVFIGKQKVENHRIRLIDYDAESLREEELQTLDDAGQFYTSDTNSWINIDGLHHVEVIQDAGRLFELHPLLMEDILNTGQRPKMEEFDTCLFFVLRMLRHNKEENIIISEQLSMVLGEKFLLTFQEQQGDVFEPVRVRIRKQKGRIRSSGVDYLAYALMDTLVDNYIAIIEHLGEEIEDLEEEVLENPTASVMEKINTYKREMNFLRKAIRPAREMVLKLIHEDFPLIQETSRPFLKDLLDLFTEATEAIDAYRDFLTDLMNLYNTAISNKMNDIMKVLTIFAALFIPLTFVAGIYGTNFEYVPELHYKYSYYIFLGVLFVMGSGLMYYFKRKNWF